MLRLIAATAAVFLTLWSPATEPEVLGQGVTAQDLIPVKALLIDPDRYLGKKVVVDGIVTAIDTGDVRRITIADLDGARTVLFELPPVGFRIPDNIVGRQIVAEGLFESIEPEPGKIGYVIRGTGAILR